MKIVFLSAAKSIHTVKWVNAMSDRGHEVYLIYNKGHEPKQDLIDKNIHLHCMKYGGSLGYYLNANELHDYVKRIQPDIIHVHYASGYGTLARVSRIGPILLSVWGSDVYEFPNESLIKKHILKRNIRYAKELASTSQCMAAQLRRVMEDESLKIKITPFGVDISFFNPRRFETKKSDLIVIGNIKSLTPTYGIKELIVAVKKLIEDVGIPLDIRNKIRLEIYGDGEQRAELVELVQKLELKEVINFRGKVPNTEVPNALSGFDIFCAMSQNESFGVSLVEAMAMEKPIVASDVDGFKEVIEDGISGIIVDRKDVNQCKEALKKLILNPKLQEQMGKKGRKRVLDLYDWKKNVDYMEEIYVKFVKNNR